MDGAALSDGVILLRPVTLDDIDEWMAGEDDEQIRWFQAPGPSSRENVVRAIENWTKSRQADSPQRHWAVCDLSTGRILGGVEIRDLGGGHCNLSYLIFPAYRRRGLSARAARLALQYANTVMGAQIAVIKVLEGNELSRSVALRLGAIQTGAEPSDQGDGTFLIFRRQLPLDR